MSGFYSRVQQWRRKVTEAECVNSDPARPPAAIDISSASSPFSSISDFRSSISDVRESPLSAIPSWLDKASVTGAMSKRKRRTATQTCQDNFDANARKTRCDKRYKAAFKSATSLLRDNMCNQNKAGKRGYGAMAVVKHINNTMLTSPSDRRLSKTVVHQATVTNAWLSTVNSFSLVVRNCNSFSNDADKWRRGNISGEDQVNNTCIGG